MTLWEAHLASMHQSLEAFHIVEEKRLNRRQALLEKAWSLVYLYATGKYSYRTLGKMHDISYQRVQQLLKLVGEPIR